MYKSDLLSIGEFAQLSRMTIKALHYYEKINLLKPSWIDPDSGYRYYDASQLHFAQIIGLFTDLDIRLNSLTDELHTEYQTIDYKKLLTYSRQTTSDKIKELNNKMRYIDYLEEILTRQNSSINVQNAATLWLLPCKDSQENLNINAALKKILSELKQHHIVVRDNYGMIMFCNENAKRLYYYVEIKASSIETKLHENIFHLPMGEYRRVHQTELDIEEIPALFEDLFTLSYDKIVLVMPATSSYSINCLLPK